MSEGCAADRMHDELLMLFCRLCLTLGSDIINGTAVRKTRR